MKLITEAQRKKKNIKLKGKQKIIKQIEVRINQTTARKNIKSKNTEGNRRKIESVNYSSPISETLPEETSVGR